MTVDRSYAATYCPKARAAFKGYASADRIAADADAGLTLVAESNGEVVGTASLVGDEIGRTYVHPDYQGLRSPIGTHTAPLPVVQLVRRGMRVLSGLDRAVEH